MSSNYNALLGKHSQTFGPEKAPEDLELERPPLFMCPGAQGTQSPNQ